MGSLPEEMPKRTHKFWFALFLVGLVVQGAFFAASPVSADRWGGSNENGTANTQAAGLGGISPVTDQVNTGGENKNNTTNTNSGVKSCTLGSYFTGDALTCIVQSVLLGVRSFAAWLAGGAAGLMVWVLDPANMSGPSGILNKSSIYELWKFIRDFFNLFFILILLLSAFATVFQIDNFSIRRIFLNLLYAALIINFSFPITRFLIDITNVPMYYFLQMIVPGADSGGLKLTEIFLGASGISATMVSPGNDFALLLMNIVFLFLFAISLLVLAVLFLVRLIALTLLLVFSPIGFAATLLPGMQKMGQEWWEKFWSYAFFGPSAALILLVSVRFMNQVGTDETYQRAKRVAIGMSAGNPEANQVTQVIFFSIPLILIWTAIGMANKSSIAGAGFVTGLGYGAAKKVGGWVKKGAWGTTKFVGKAAVAPVAPFARGAKEGVKDAMKSGKWFGGDINKIPGGKFLTGKYYKTAGENREAMTKGLFTGGFGGVQKEKDKLYQKQINEKVAKNKENKISRSAALKDTESSDEVTRVAAAVSLAQMDNGIQTMEDLNKTLKALSDPSGRVKSLYQDRAAEIINRADKKIIASTAATATDPAKSGIQNLTHVIDTLGKDNQKAIADLINKLEEPAFSGTGDDMEELYVKMGAIAPTLNTALKAKMFKEGGARVLVEHLTRPGGPGVTDQNAVETVLADIRSVKDIVASVELFRDPRYGAHAKRYLNSIPSRDRKQEIKKAAAQEYGDPSIFF